MISSAKAIRLAIAAAFVGILCGLDGASAASRNYHQTVGSRAADRKNNDGQKKHDAVATSQAADLAADLRVLQMTDEPTGSLTPEPTMVDNINQMILEEFEEMVIEEKEPTPVAGTLLVPTPEATRPEPVTDEPTGESKFQLWEDVKSCDCWYFVEMHHRRMVAFISFCHSPSRLSRISIYIQFKTIATHHTCTKPTLL